MNTFEGLKETRNRGSPMKPLQRFLACTFPFSLRRRPCSNCPKEHICFILKKSRKNLESACEYNQWLVKMPSLSFNLAQKAWLVKDGDVLYLWFLNILFAKEYSKATPPQTGRIFSQCTEILQTHGEEKQVRFNNSKILQKLEYS